MKKFDSVQLVKKILFFVSCLILAFVLWCIVKYNELSDVVSAVNLLALK